MRKHDVLFFSFVVCAFVLLIWFGVHQTLVQLEVQSQQIEAFQEGR